MPHKPVYAPTMPPYLEQEQTRIDSKVRDILRDYMEIIGRPSQQIIGYPRTMSKPYSYYWKIGDERLSVQVYLYVDKPTRLLGRLGSTEEPHLLVLISDAGTRGHDVLGRIFSRETGLLVKMAVGTLHYDYEGGLNEKVTAIFRPDDPA